jgi:formylglycine-generating enzyme required for sulfatase activity
MPETLATKAAPAPEFPDDPRKWDGWSNYRAENVYARLCLDPRANPSAEQIQQHCGALLQWWQKKLPLKSQPSNPLAQLLGRGIDEASRYLVQARIDLLDPIRRRQIDIEIAAAAHAEAQAEFAKYVAFSIKDGLLTAEAEANLIEFGQHNGFSEEQVLACINKEVWRKNARRAARDDAPMREAAEPIPSEDAEEEFLRIVRLSDVNMTSATDSVRKLFSTIAHNLGIDLQSADDLLDEYLEQEELLLCNGGSSAAVQPVAVQVTQPPAVAEPIRITISNPEASRLPARVVNPLGAPMLLIAAGEFVMGSAAPDAAPNEQPLTPVKLSQFYISRHPVTNAHYERFDPDHRGKRMPGAGDDHPVVYVTSLEAIKFAQWLGQKDGKKYRLPTEAEWEYAARGTDGRKYPWGNHDGCADLANFADSSTTFPWRDARLNDGYAGSSPVGAFPHGASFFGVEDMAGNVWEWCLDFLQPLAGTPKLNPRGAGPGNKRVYRGGSWKSRFSNLRATARASNAPNYSCNDLGFRIVCECGRPELRQEPVR